VIRFRGFAAPPAPRANNRTRARASPARLDGSPFRALSGPSLLASSLTTASAPALAVTARPAIALGRASRWLAFSLAASASLGVAAALAWAGAWPVLPYSLIEVGVLAAAFVAIERRARRVERLVVDGDRVIVERSDGMRCERHEFNRHWLRVDVRAPQGRCGGALELRYAGESIEFGDALRPAEREALARTLRRLAASR
jgi:uncharacterized membrane protein